MFVNWKLNWNGIGETDNPVSKPADIRNCDATERVTRAAGERSRWVVERTSAWLSNCRAILVRYDKKPANYLGLLQLACALIWYRRQRRLAVLR